jgi:hypothetical protein
MWALGALAPSVFGSRAIGGCRGGWPLLMARLQRSEGLGAFRTTPESGRSSGVEHNLAKVGVEGSNPFARSRFPRLIRMSAAVAARRCCRHLPSWSPHPVLAPAHGRAPSYPPGPICFNSTPVCFWLPLSTGRFGARSAALALPLSRTPAIVSVMLTSRIRRRMIESAWAVPRLRAVNDESLPDSADVTRGNECDDRSRSGEDYRELVMGAMTLACRAVRRTTA